MIFMPRIDLWAVETSDQVYQEDSCSSVKPESVGKEAHLHNNGDDERNFNHSAEQAGDALKRASYLWSSFVEQVETICVSTSVMLLVCTLSP